MKTRSLSRFAGSSYLGNTSNHVVDHGSDGSEARDVLPAALPDGEEDLGLLALNDSDVHVHMANVFGEGSSRACDRDNARLYGDFNSLGNGEFFDLLDVQHLKSKLSQDASKPSRVHPIRQSPEARQNGAQTGARRLRSRMDNELGLSGRATYLDGEFGEVGVWMERSPDCESRAAYVKMTEAEHGCQRKRGQCWAGETVFISVPLLDGSPFSRANLRL